MHPIQQKILALSKSQNLAGLSLRKIGELIGEPNSPQKIKHHIDKLKEKGLLNVSDDGKKLQPEKIGLDKNTNLISLPILGSANCGDARTYADGDIEGYLKISLKILGEKFKNRLNNLFVLRASGNSMNRANVNGKTIDDGDFVIAEKTSAPPQNGEYIVSIIEGLANIKKFLFDAKNKHIILASESSMNFPPLYIHELDYADYFVGGKVVDVIKQPEEFPDSSIREVLKYGKPITKASVKEKK
ncbi:MAG: S24 family peptidase [Candidatus Paceibacterota bacterium]|jgi:repressor LexA